MDNSKDDTKNTYSGRSATNPCRSATESGRSPLASAKFVAHQFEQYRKEFGLLIKKMREERKLKQSDLGAPTQIRRLENGEVAQVSRMEVVAKMVPCPREMLKLFRATIMNLPVACTKCRGACEFKDCGVKELTERYFTDLTVELPEDFEIKKD